jgi:hypothetical protein
VGSLALRPGNSLTILKMALSVGFIRFISSADATQATESLTPHLVGLSPTDRASLSLDALVRKNVVASFGAIAVGIITFTNQMT